MADKKQKDLILISMVAIVGIVAVIVLILGMNGTPQALPFGSMTGAVMFQYTNPIGSPIHGSYGYPGRNGGRVVTLFCPESDCLEAANNFWKNCKPIGLARRDLTDYFPAMKVKCTFDWTARSSQLSMV